MAPPPARQTATLHALTERLAAHSRMGPLMGMPTGFPSALSSQAMAAAANAYRLPAPPPQLPLCPIYSRHQDQGLQDAKEPDGVVLGDGQLRCPRQRQWGLPNEHRTTRVTALSEDELSQFLNDMSKVARREFDCWIEQCWCVISPELEADEESGPTCEACSDTATGPRRFTTCSRGHYRP